jgi:hypothetical protein
LATDFGERMIVQRLFRLPLEAGRLLPQLRTLPLEPTPAKQQTSVIGPIIVAPAPSGPTSTGDVANCWSPAKS